MILFRLPLLLLALSAFFVITAVSYYSAADGPPKKTLVLPKSPHAAAYVPGRLSNKELIEAPRSEFVYVALLERKALDRECHTGALEET